VRIIQGKPFLKRGPSNHSQSSFRRRSIRLAKADQVKRDSKRIQPRRESDQECKSIMIAFKFSCGKFSCGKFTKIVCLCSSFDGLKLGLLFVI